MFRGVDDITFEYQGVIGSYTITGPVLRFRIKIDYRAASDQNNVMHLNLIGGKLYVSQKQQMFEVANLNPTIGHRYIQLNAYASTTVDFEVQFTPDSFQRFLETATDRLFSITLFYNAIVENPTKGGIPASLNINTLKGLLFVNQKFVEGLVNGSPNAQFFKINAEEWAKAVESTKAAFYVSDSFLVMNTERKYVQDLLKVLEDAKKLLLEGHIPEAVGKAREICAWAGYKPKGEPERYAKLKSFELSESERDGLKDLLDALWSWTAKGHHTLPSSEELFTEEQAWMSIHLGYLLVSYLSKKQQLG